MSELDVIRALIREELANIGPSMLPGGPNAIPGFDPHQETTPLRVEAPLGSDGQLERAVGAGESLPFEFHIDIEADGITGVVVSVPGTPKSGSFTIDGGDPHPVEDFNTSVGRLAAGSHVIKGIFTNGQQPGILRLGAGAPAAFVPTPSADASGSFELSESTALFTTEQRYTVLTDSWAALGGPVAALFTPGIPHSRVSNARHACFMFVDGLGNTHCAVTGDAGSNWDQPSPTEIAACYALRMAADDALYALAAGEILKSTDGGSTFVQTTPLLEIGDTFEAYGLAAHPTDANRLVAWAQTVDSNLACYITTDAGAHWTRSLALTPGDYVGNAIAAGWLGDRLIMATFNNGDSLTHAYYSDDDAVSFVDAYSGALTGDPMDFATGAGAAYVMVDAGGALAPEVLRSLDGAAFTEQAVGYVGNAAGIAYLAGKVYVLYTDGTLKGITDPSTAFTVGALAAATIVVLPVYRDLGAIA